MSFSSKMAEAVISGTTAFFDRISGPGFDQENQEYGQSHSSGRHEAGGPGLRPTDEEILDQEFRRQSHKLAKLESAIGHINHEIRSIKADLPDSQARNQETKKEIETVNQDLTATRAHAPDEGTMRKGEVVNDFEALLRLMSNLVNDFLAWYSQFLAKPLSERRARTIRKHFQGKHGMQDADNFVGLVSEPGLKLFAQLLLRHYLCSALIQQVFRPLLPGKRLDDVDSGVLFEILRTVQVEESQDRSGRWRALMYKQALIQEPRDTAWCADISTEFVREAVHLMGLLSDAEPTDDVFRSALTSTMEIFEAAALFKDRAMKICTEVDFLVYVPDSNWKLDQGIIREACKSTVVSRSVILGVGLGLQLSCNVQTGSKYVRESEYSILASAVGDKGALIRQAWYQSGR